MGFVDLIEGIRDSWTVDVLVSVFAFLFGLIGMLLVIFGVLFILKRVFKGDKDISRAYRATIYLLTMATAIVLFMGGILGIVIPAIPGFLLLIFSLLLFRRYHKSHWVDSQIQYIRIKLQLKKEVKEVQKGMHRGREQVKERFKKTKMGKALRRPGKGRK
ncbi:hypothetical protein GOV11_00030 [Candidatus Woesearchaeota archaeon]|nr:hypothetical protein [Candidatus Woesearchaeota archaeon]